MSATLIAKDCRRIVKGSRIEVRHATGIVEQGRVEAIRDFGHEAGCPVQVDVLWADGTRCWVPPIHVTKVLDDRVEAV